MGRLKAAKDMRASANGQAHQVEPDDDFPVACADQVKGLKLRHLWRERLAFGSVTLLEGRKGDGKSTLAAAVAAQVTGGPHLPGERGRGVGSVLWLAGEESVAVSTRAKLKASGADLARVQFPGCDGSGRLTHRLFFPGDGDRLERLVKKYTAWLVVFDPLSSFVAPGIDLMNGQQARAVLESMQTVADCTGAAFLAIRHLIKSGRGDARNQGMGSSEIGNVARAVLRCDRHPEEREHWVLSVVVTNLGKRAQSLVYGLEGEPGVPVIRWLGSTDLDADELAEGGYEPADRCAQADAKTLIRSLLDAEPLRAEVMYLHGTKQGLTPKMLRTARLALRVETFQKKHEGQRCHWWRKPASGWPADA